MDALVEFFRRLMEPNEVLLWGGLAAIGLIVFVETGLLVGFFLPGDSLLVTAGVLAAAGYFDVAALLAIAFVAAVAGDQVNYLFGRRAGRGLAHRYPRLRRHVQRAEAFYRRYGGRTIVLARFVPIVRTFAPAVAGAAEMEYRRFTVFNVAGGAVWVTSTIGGGYLLGHTVPDIDRYLTLVIAAVVAASLAPIAVERWRRLRRRRTAATP